MGRAEPPLNLARVGGAHCWEQRVPCNRIEADTRFQFPSLSFESA